MTRAQQGDEQAFEELVRTYLPLVYRFVLRIVRHAQTAEDVTQDAFLNAYRALPRFTHRAKFSTWLFRIAHNGAIESLRRSSRQQRLVQRVGPDERAPPDLDSRMVLRAAIDDLPDDLRRCFTLVEVLGFGYPDACEVLGWPIGTLKSRMHRARKLLIAALEDTDEV